jgi:hypothetical protein
MVGNCGGYRTHVYLADKIAKHDCLCTITELFCLNVIYVAHVTFVPAGCSFACRMTKVRRTWCPGQMVLYALSQSIQQVPTKTKTTMTELISFSIC